MIPGLPGIQAPPTLPGGTSIGGQMLGGLGGMDLAGFIQQLFANRAVGGGMTPTVAPGAGVQQIMPQVVPPKPRPTAFQLFQNIRNGQAPFGTAQGDAAGRGPAGGFGRPERDFRDWAGI